MKKREWQQADRPWLLAVEDPQQLGKDIGAGTYNIRNVQHLFAAAAATLRGCMEQETEEERWAAVQVDIAWHGLTTCYLHGCIAWHGLKSCVSSRLQCLYC